MLLAVGGTPPGQAHIKVFEEVLQVSKELIDGCFLPINTEPRQELAEGPVHQLVLLLHACELSLSIAQEFLKERGMGMI